VKAKVVSEILDQIIDLTQYLNPINKAALNKLREQLKHN